MDGLPPRLDHRCEMCILSFEKVSHTLKLTEQIPVNRVIEKFKSTWMVTAFYQDLVKFLRRILAYQGASMRVNAK